MTDGFKEEEGHPTQPVRGQPGSPVPEEVQEEAATPALETVEQFVRFLAGEECETLTAVLIVAEAIDAEARPSLHYFFDDLSPPWKILGMHTFFGEAFAAEFLADPVDIVESEEED